MTGQQTLQLPADGPDEYDAYLGALDADILSPTVRAGYTHWRSLLHGKRMPKRREIDATAIARQLLHVTLIDVGHDPPSFKARLAGEYVRLRQGIGPGTRIAEQVAEAQARDRLLARLTMCAEQRRPILGLYRYIPLDQLRQQVWVQALACPLSDDGQTVNHIICFGADHDFKVPPDAKEWP